MFITRHRWWCSRVQVPAVWRLTLRRRFSVHAKVFSPSIRRNMKISRQHDSHGSTLTATAVSSVTVCSIYSSVHWKNDLFTARKWTDLKYFSPATPEVGKQLHFYKRLADKLFVIKTSLVDLMQLSSKMYSPEAPKSTEKNYKEKIKQIEKKIRIDSITQCT